MRELTTRNWGVSMERRVKEINRFTVGWTAYSALADTALPLEKLNKWLRLRLKQVRWKEWKSPQTRSSRSVSPAGTLAAGRPRKRGTGASPGPGHSKRAAP